MKYSLILLFLLAASPAVAEPISIQLPSSTRHRVIDVVRRGGSRIYVVLDTTTGEVTERIIDFPQRRIHVSRRVWDPYSGRFREIVGYDEYRLRVYADLPNHAHVVYWITDKSRFNTNPLQPPAPTLPQQPSKPALSPCCGYPW